MVVSATAKHNSRGGRKIPFNNIMTENFIRTYTNALPDALIKTLLQMIDQQVMYSPKASTRSDKFRKDNDMNHREEQMVKMTFLEGENFLAWNRRGY